MCKIYVWTLRQYWGCGFDSSKIVFINKVKNSTKSSYSGFATVALRHVSNIFNRIESYILVVLCNPSFTGIEHFRTYFNYKEVQMSIS